MKIRALFIAKLPGYSHSAALLLQNRPFSVPISHYSEGVPLGNAPK